MPTPEQVAMHHQLGDALLDAFRRADPPPASQLMAAIAGLRDDIAALRSELAPSSSTILTGRDVVAEFSRLQGGRHA